MATGFSDVGAFNVDGQWATAIRYEAESEGGRVRRVRLRFTNGRSELGSVALAADGAAALLGADNFDRVKEAVAAAASAGEPTPIKGELRGKQLTFRQVTLSPPGEALENTIEPDQAVRPQVASSHPSAHPSEAPAAAAAVPTPALAAPASPASPAESTDVSSALAVPGWVRERFVTVGNRYYFPDRTLAFTDRGRKLKAESHNAEVVRGLVEIAEARGWQAIKVAGTTEFRREVWRQGQAHGIDVRGYEPSEVEQAAAHQRAPSTAAAGVPGATDRVAPPHPSVLPRPGPSDRLSGVLVDAGAAPYRFDPANGLSYFLKVQTERGERTVWGADLERALVESESRVQVGDRVEVERQGSQPVTVPSLQRNADGHAVDTRIEAQRARWVVETQAYFAARAERAAALRDSDPTAAASRAGHPDPTAALVTLWLGEQFAQRYVDRPADRDRVVVLVKERLVGALARGEAIRAPALRAEVQARLDQEDEMAPHVQPRARRPARIPLHVQRQRGDRAPDAPAMG